MFNVSNPPRPKGAEKRPQRNVVAAVMRSRPGDMDPACRGGVVFGLTLSCGHYVERYQLPAKRARCDDCARRAPEVRVLTTACPLCYGGGEDVDRVCQRCLGFGRVEAPMPDVARPGEAGDHVAAFWTLCDGQSDLVTILAKRGSRWLTEHRRIGHLPSNPEDTAITKADVPPLLSERTHVHAHESQQATLDHAKRTFVQVHSTDHARFKFLLNFAITFMHPEYAKAKEGV